MASISTSAPLTPLDCAVDGASRPYPASITRPIGDNTYGSSERQLDEPAEDKAQGFVA
jgi:hypothetical protein